MSKKFFIICAIFSFGITAFGIINAFAQETLTITTYYPSPYGSYAELHADGMTIGSGYRTTAPPTDGLIVQGNVGIGTTGPLARLHVNIPGAGGGDNSVGIISHADIDLAAIGVDDIEFAVVNDTTGAVVRRTMTINNSGNVGIGTAGAVGAGGLLQVGGTTANACGIFANTTANGRPAMLITTANTTPSPGSSSPAINAISSGGPTSGVTNVAPAIHAESTTAWNDQTGGWNHAIEGIAENGWFGTGVYGKGSANPSATLRVGAGVKGINSGNYGVGVVGSASDNDGWGVYGEASSTTGSTAGVRGESASSTGRGVVAYASHTTGTNYALRARTESQTNGWAGWFEGKVNITANLYHDGTLHTGWDFAEYIKTSDGLIEEGDVVSIDKDQNVSITKSKSKYDTAVLGVISTSPGDIGGLLRHEDGSPYSKEEMLKAGFRLLSLAGQVPCKVTTENGPINRGDILVTSSKPGYAMKADLDKVKPGMIVGKALEPLEKGEGKIIVLVD